MKLFCVGGDGLRGSGSIGDSPLKLIAIRGEGVFKLSRPVLRVLASTVIGALRRTPVLFGIRILAEREIEAIGARFALEGLSVSLGSLLDVIFHVWRLTGTGELQ